MHALTLLLTLLAQRPDSLAAQVREYVAVDTSLLALTHVLLVDGTGAAPKPDQTIVIRAGRIAAVGPAASVQIPAGARVMDLNGSTVIPGLIGMHDHLFYTAAGKTRSITAWRRARASISPRRISRVSTAAARWRS